MPGPCRLCVVVTSPFTLPTDRRCAFNDAGFFQDRNLGCATLEKLRGLAMFALSVQVGDVFVRLAPIAHADRFVLLFWRDQSHRIDQAVEVRAGGELRWTPLTLAFAEEVIGAKTPRPRTEHIR